MPNFSLGAWLFLTVALATIVGTMAWMVSQGYIPGSSLAAVLGTLLTAIVAVVFHQAGASAALATPAPAAATPASKPVAAVPAQSA